MPPSLSSLASIHQNPTRQNPPRPQRQSRRLRLVRPEDHGRGEWEGLVKGFRLRLNPPRRIQAEAVPDETDHFP